MLQRVTPLLHFDLNGPPIEYIHEFNLHWLRINERIEFIILILTHRAFDETGPMYLNELIKKHNSSNRTRRANDHYLLSIPPYTVGEQKRCLSSRKILSIVIMCYWLQCC